MRDGRKAKIIDLNPIGEGAQGKVYKISIEGDSNQYALKWYDHESTESLSETFEQNLMELVGISIENPTKYEEMRNYFTIPLALTERNAEGEYGYIMDYIDPGVMVKLEEIIDSGKTQFENVPVLLETCINISAAFSNLDFKGYTYTDINEGSIFINVKNGDIKICDCDNIVRVSTSTNLIGTRGFMAPEVIRGEQPTPQSDYHSLAVILFQLLTRGSPFEGKGTREYIGSPEEIDRRIFCDEPKFVMIESLNNPPFDEDVSKIWKLFNNRVKSEFIKTFKDGLKNPESRTHPDTWQGMFNTWKRSHSFIPSEYELLIKKIRKQKRQLLLYVVDVSNSMSGIKMDNVNYAINDSIKKINRKKVAPSIDLEVGILEFSKDCKWYGETGELQNIKKINEVKIEVGGKFTNYYKACMELDRKLSVDYFFKNDSEYKHTTIILITDGYSSTNYEDEFNELSSNIHFIRSKRFAIGIDDSNNESDKALLLKFVNNEESNYKKTSDLSEIVNAIVSMSTSVVKDNKKRMSIVNSLKG